MPSKYLSDSKFEEKLEKLEEKLIDQTLKPFEPSGHAFVCFDSVGSVRACQQQFNVTAYDYVKYTCQEIKEKLTTCFGLFKPNSTRNRSKSTLMKFAEQEDD